MPTIHLPNVAWGNWHRICLDCIDDRHHEFHLDHVNTGNIHIPAQPPNMDNPVSCPLTVCHGIAVGEHRHDSESLRIDD